MLIQKCNFSYTCFLRRAIAPRQLGLLYKSRQHYFSSIVENFRNATTNPASKYQIFISKTFDPFLNLSIEHFLLEETPADSTVLFLYVNSPCVVIGRNQNPWLETNMKLLKSQSIIRNKKSQVTRDNVQLVRRRSGGGAVFHDYGNVNYSVICPTANFSRDKYAEMVTQVIRQSNPRARVNERHDIVLDQGLFRGEIDQLDPADLHRTAYHIQGTGPLPLKVSGSAYKLIRKRSLHHGTCLVASSNLTSISRFLHSEAKPFMKARGVESVRSPIGNIHNIDLSDTNDHIFDFQTQVVQAFADMHGISHSEIAQLIQGGQESFVQTRNEYALGLVGDELRNITDVATGLDELKVRLQLYSVGSS